MPVTQSHPGIGNRHWSWSIMACVCVPCVLLTWVIMQWFQYQNHQTIHQNTELRINLLATQLTDKLDQLTRGLRGMRGAMAISGMERMPRSSFQTYMAARDMAQEFPGAVGFGFIRRITLPQQAAFINEARLHLNNDFAISPALAGDDERLIITLAEPSHANEAWLGRDLAVLPSVLAVAKAASDSGAAMLTAPITHANNHSSTEPSLLMLLPVYQPDALLDSPQDRHAATVGWLYARIALNAVAEAAQLSTSRLSYQLAEVSDFEPLRPIYATADYALRNHAQYEQQQTITLFGQHWRITARPTDDLIAALHLPALKMIFVLGAIMSILVAGAVTVVMYFRLRSRMLYSQEQLFSSFVANSTDAIVIESLDGHVLDWNPQAEQLFGYSAAEARGRLLSELIIPLDKDFEDTDILKRTSKGQRIVAFDTRRRHRNGELLDVAITAVPVYSHAGNIRAVARTLRDIRGQKALENINANLKSESVQQLAQLNLAQQGMQALLNAMPAVVAYLDKDLRIRFANQTATLWFGAHDHQMRDLHLGELLGHEGFITALQYVDKLDTGDPANFEVSVERPLTQGTRHLSVQLAPHIVDGKLTGIYAVMHDVTDLIEQRERYVELAGENWAIMNTLNEHSLVSMTDRNGKITYANARFCNISGYSLQELTGQNHRIVNSGTHPPEFWKAIWRTLASGNSWRGEICNRRKDGQLYWVDSIIAPFFDAQRRITKYLSIRFDVTEHKLMQRRIQESESLLTTVEKVSGVGGFAIDLATMKHYWTDQAYIIHELSTDEQPTHELFEHMLAPDALEFFRKAFSDTVATGAPYDIELPITTAGGREIWIRTSGTLEYQDNKPVRLVGTLQDVTERRMQDQMLRDATITANNANRAKSEFLANMSHEIRTPLNAIVGMGYLLEQSELNAEQQVMLEKVQFASRSLLGVINNVLDLAKIEANEMQLDEMDFSLDEMLNEIHGILSNQASQKQVELIIQTLHDVPKLLYGDMTRLRQILTNLVNNAIKFTNDGSVKLITSLAAQTDGRVELSFTITDTGCGIDTVTMTRLFAPFTQADATTTRKFGGTGLGLSIARRLARLMGGDIAVTSTLGQGTEFCVQLPFSLAHESSKLLGTQSRHTFEIVVTLREEKASSVITAARALSWHVTALASTAALFEELKRRPPYRWPDAVLVDALVDECDPAQFKSQCDSLFAGQSPPGVVVILDGAMAKTTQQAFAVLADAILHWPLESAALFDAVTSAVRKHDASREKLFNATQSSDLRAQWLTGVRVLLVDDSDTNLMVARTLIEKQGGQVTTRTDGQQAIDLLRAAQNDWDIILMDIQMPIMDGNEATRLIRTDLNMKDIPIIALTAGALMTERQLCLAAGMNDFLSKPFEPQALIRVVRQQLERVRGTSLAITLVDRANQFFDPGMASIDNQVVQQMFGDDSALFKKTLRHMINEYAEYALPNHADLNDFVSRKQLQLRMHKLKGSAGMIGAVGLQRLAGTLEKALLEDQPADFVHALLTELAGAMTTLAEEAQATEACENSHEVPPLPSSIDEVAGATRLSALRLLLESQNLDALDRFEELKPWLAQHLDYHHLQQASHALEQLEFAQVASLLAQLDSNPALPQQATG